MAKFTFNFNHERFMAELERDPVKFIHEEIEASSSNILSEYIGEMIESICPACKHPEMKVIPDGKACCPMCGHTDKVRLELNWG